ncbi:MAG: response regulator, partial [Campylobacterota bacterium]|nr:response regulator [Campylobacterota bacterium]
MENRTYRLPWYHSLKFTLFKWLLIVSVVPGIIMFIIDYRINAQNLEGIAKNNLLKENHLHKELISNWFESTTKNISLIAQRQNTIEFYKSIQTLYHSKENLDQTLKSFEYAVLEHQYDHDFKELINTLDYIYNFFFIDLEGNIIYTLKKESDLGTNLLNGRYSKTKFAKSFQKTLKSGTTSFSDLERYAPSNNSVNGFITQLIIDLKGDIIGVLAIQVKPNFIINILEKSDPINRHYLIGTDGLLRHDLFKEHKVLEYRINTQQFDHWHQEHISHKNFLAHHEKFFDYQSFNDKRVLGINSNIDLFGIQWVLISEIEHDFLLNQANSSLQALTVAFILLGILTIFSSIYISNRIANPINHLALLSNAFRVGVRDITIEKSRSNEIGELQLSLQKMIDTIKNDEKKLEEANQKATLAIASAKAGTIFFDLKKAYLEWDRRSMEIFGVDESNFHNDYDSWLKRLHPEDLPRMNQAFENALTYGENIKHNYRIIRPDGELRYIRVNANIMRDEMGNAHSITGLHFDETEHKETQKAIIDAKNEAEEASRAKSQFLANMSHEIRTPMNAIMGMSYLALQNELDPKIANYIQKVHRSAEGLLQIINDILDYSKIEAQKLELESVPFSLEELLEDISNIVGLKAQEKEIEIIYNIAHDVPRFLKGDPLRLGQILLNLGSNAVKFTPIAGEIILSIEVEQKNKQIFDLKFCVKDTGVGIAKAKLKNLFEAFSQEDNSTTRQYGGTGLGLTISKNLVELMGGRICVQSTEGLGSTFSFIIPLEISYQAKESIALPHSLLKDKRVLIVDDNSTSIEVLTDILEYYQLAVDSAQDRDEAIEKLKKSKKITTEQPYDLLLVDWKMSKLNGAQTLQKIRDNLKIKNTPAIIMIPTYEREEVQQQVLNLDITSFIIKPIIEGALLNAMMVAMGILKQELGVKELFQKDIHESIQALSGAKILLVEDNDTNQELALDLLSSNGIGVELAHHGAEAIEMIKEGEYDGILMDCQMPIMDGYEATRIIRQDPNFANLPILAMTANAMKGDKEEVIEAGMNDHIPKPIDPHHLFRTMAQWIKPKKPIEIEVHNEEFTHESEPSLPYLDGIETTKGLKSVMG